MSIDVRRATTGDAERLAQINIDAWKAAYAGLVTDARLDSMQLTEYVDRWQGTLTGKSLRDAVVFVATLDGAVACYCVGGPYRPPEGMAEDDTASWGELYALYTDPTMAGRGAGSSAHDALLAYLVSDGFDEAALWVLTSNQRARKWYAARGWRPDGAVNDWVSHGVAHPEVRLRRTLGRAAGAQAG